MGKKFIVNAKIRAFVIKCLLWRTLSKGKNHARNDFKPSNFLSERMMIMSKKGRNIYKRKDGRWEGRIYCYGNKKYKSVYGKSYAQVKEKILLIENDFPIMPGENSFLFNTIIIEWLDEHRDSIKESSYYCYKSKIKKHILPFFKNMKYNAVDENKIKDFIKLKKSEKFSAKYIADMVVIIKSAAKWCEKSKGYINRTVSAANIKVKYKEPQLLNISQQKILQDYLLYLNTSTSIGIYLCMFTGLRIGELCALKWSDIDLDERMLHINKTAQRLIINNKSSVSLTPPKTGNSIRIIPLPAFLVKKLEEFKTDNDCFLLSGTNKIVEPRCLTYRFKTILKKANLPMVKFHSLRHTFATNCLQQKFDIKTLSEILGHANVNVTMKIYVHSSMERKIECMKTLKPFA